ncbi:MAG: iron ABC transporter permease [Clostridiales bacterium]|nr:iron ABC transporter permease [Clostridiales bacterium]
MKKVLTTSILIICPVFFIVLSLFIGIYGISFGDMINTLLHPLSSDTTLSTVVWDLRFPRAVAAAFCGAALSVSGAAFQGVFRNPLVNSGILGVSNGAGFGACLAIVFLGGGKMTYISAFLFAVFAVILAYLSGKVGGTSSVVTLILGGTIVSSFFSALISILKVIADPYSQLPSITFWFMGSFASINYSHFIAFIPILTGISLIYLCRWRINALSMGAFEAESLGVDTRLYNFLIIGGATLATSAAVCISGTIGWVGLIIPHIGRMITGSDNRRLIPVSISLGASFMIIIDLLSRNLSSSEIPIGILCSLIGAPFFVYLLKKTKGGGWK